MTRYIFRRLLFVPPLLIAGSILVFALLRVVPGDPAAAMLGTEATPRQVALPRQRLGLNDSLPIQYLKWVTNVATGDLGRSSITNQPIMAQIRSRLPVTLEILVLSLVLGTLFGVSFGVLSAVFQNSPLDYIIRVFSVFMLSILAFFALTLLILLPSLWWNYVPPLDYASPFDDPVRNLRIFLPPTLLLALESSAGLMRYTRSVCLDVLRQDYVRTARAKGLVERVVISRHMLKNAMVPIITILGACRRPAWRIGDLGAGDESRRDRPVHLSGGDLARLPDCASDDALHRRGRRARPHRRGRELRLVRPAHPLPLTSAEERR